MANRLPTPRGRQVSEGLQWSKRIIRTQSSAAKAYPILKKYSHHWATAAIAARYMQNVRRRARNMGHLPKRAKHNRGGSQRERSSSVPGQQDGFRDGSGDEDSD
ncbi:hypothetical protein TRAPUB_9828 [Trametes pubescens]|uniref:Uncharacterized protein n=1 Tax=Trametes pubescens TaxID=154538 RepID=A0A1M2W198_TRAPU|nr:hypothetical protein TRAPUB_9828 [Trametes pubescens]